MDMGQASVVLNNTQVIVFRTGNHPIKYCKFGIATAFAALEENKQLWNAVQLAISGIFGFDPYVWRAVCSFGWM